MRGEKSQPDWKEFKEVILRQKEPSRVPLFELHIDKEVVRYFVENLLVREWVEPTLAKERRDQEAVLQNNILVWHQLGYDYLRLTADFRFSASLSFASRSRAAQDTANLSRGTRKWAEEGKGAITTREDFEKFPWPSLEEVDPWPFEFLSKNLPSGMGFFATFSQGIFEILTNELLGLESLGYLIYDNLELVEAVTDKVGELIYGCYRKVLGLDNLLGFVQGDDMGFKTATLVSPQFLRNYVLPWHKKLAHLAHSHNLLYILHSCGNLGPIMEDLISEVKIDAKHSFEDAIMPVAEFNRSSTVDFEKSPIINDLQRSKNVLALHFISIAVYPTPKLNYPDRRRNNHPGSLKNTSTVPFRGGTNNKFFSSACYRRFS